MISFQNLCNINKQVKLIKEAPGKFSCQQISKRESQRQQINTIYKQRFQNQCNRFTIRQYAINEYADHNINGDNNSDNNNYSQSYENNNDSQSNDLLQGQQNKSAEQNKQQNGHTKNTYNKTVYVENPEVPITNEKTHQTIRNQSKFGTFFYINQTQEWQSTFKDKYGVKNSNGTYQKQAKQDTGFSITYLGTSSGSPTYQRNTSAIAVSLKDEWYLVDCGGGTIYQIIAAGLDISKLRGIFITHLHGDHQFGLVPVIKAINDQHKLFLEQQQQKNETTKGRKRKTKSETDVNAKSKKDDVDAEVEKQIIITGPPGLFKILYTCLQSLSLLETLQIKLKIVEHVMYIEDQKSHNLCNDQVTYASQAPDQASDPNFNDFERIWSYQKIAKRQNLADDELLDCVDGISWSIFNNDKIKVESATLQHAVPCIGYVFTEKIPQPNSDILPNTDESSKTDGGVKRKPRKSKKQQSIEEQDDKEIKPIEENIQSVSEQYLPRKAVVLGDTCNSQAIYKLGYGADFLSHEATFNQNQKDLAVRARHSTSIEAGRCAENMKVDTLVLTHFGGRIDKPQDFKSQQRNTNRLLQEESSFQMSNCNQLQMEAQNMFGGNVYVAHDFYTYNIPQKLKDSQNKQKNQVQNQKARYNKVINNKQQEQEQVISFLGG